MTARKIPLGHLKVSELGKRYVRDALDHDRLSAGHYTALFEKHFARLHDCRHAIFMNSGTSALMVALQALKIKHGMPDGTGVLVPSVTFVATLNAVLHCRLNPVLVDVDPETFLMDVGKIPPAAHYYKPVSIALPVHLFGLPFDVSLLHDSLYVIEDSCEAMFVKCNGLPVGSVGDFGCFSTYVSHVLTTGVGGLVTCQDDYDMRLARSLMCHGRHPNYINIDQDDAGDPDVIHARFRFPYVGWSFRSTEMEAALGCAALEERAIAINCRSAVAKRYRERLVRHVNAGRLSRQVIPDGHEHANMLFPIVLGEYKRWRHNDEMLRGNLMLHLEKHGVETRLAMPLTNQPCYADLLGDVDQDFPVAAWLNRSGLCLPCHEGLTVEDVDYVCDLIDDFLGGKT